MCINVTKCYLCTINMPVNEKNQNKILFFCKEVYTLVETKELVPIHQSNNPKPCLES